MGKYDAYAKMSPEYQKIKKQVHPIWRGIGFIMAIAVPFFSYVAALVIFQENNKNHWFPIPTDLITTWGSDPYVFVKLAMTVVIIVIISAIMLLVTFVSDSLFGAPRYGPQDSPPIRREEKPRYSKR